MCFGSKGLGAIVNPIGAVLGDKSPSAMISKSTGIKALDPNRMLAKNTEDPAPAPLAPAATAKKPVKTALGEKPAGKTALGS